MSYSSPEALGFAGVAEGPAARYHALCNGRDLLHESSRARRGASAHRADGLRRLMPDFRRAGFVRRTASCRLSVVCAAFKPDCRGARRVCRAVNPRQELTVADRAERTARRTADWCPDDCRRGRCQGRYEGVRRRCLRCKGGQSRSPRWLTKQFPTDRDIADIPRSDLSQSLCSDGRRAEEASDGTVDVQGSRWVTPMAARR